MGFTTSPRGTRGSQGIEAIPPTGQEQFLANKKTKNSSIHQRLELQSFTFLTEIQRSPVPSKRAEVSIMVKRGHLQLLPGIPTAHHAMVGHLRKL